MKKKFLNCCLNLIKNNNPNISDVELDEIRYGLEGLYLTITKMIFIFILSYLLGLLKETMLMLIFFNVLRTTAFGLHASKSWMCWISSTILFILFPVVAKYVTIPFYLKLGLGILGIILISLFAPADTVKHPLINKKKRRIWKILSILDCSILVTISLIIKNDVIANLIIFGVYTEILLINPLSYKLFKLKYNNYKNYELGY
jgi:accessory gene regulator B